MGIDISTTAFSVGVRSPEGEEDFVSVPMIGATTWHDQPAFNLLELPTMFNEALDQLKKKDWIFALHGTLSLSVRQHDMVFVGRRDQLPLIPALSWQCNAASAEIAEQQEAGAEAIVGKLEDRFILGKAAWALKQEADLRKKISWIMTTGDYVAWRLTDQLRLSTSDALSNGLLIQQTKRLATRIIENVGLESAWFPEVIQSGKIVGQVLPPDNAGHNTGWAAVKNKLAGWWVIAPLGDNHAGAVGCGLADPKTIIVSAGSSGTVVRCCNPEVSLVGEAAWFEYYEHRLLLLMLADCAVWYARFVKNFGQGKDLQELNDLALKVGFDKVLMVTQEKTDDGWKEVYPEGWKKLSLEEQVASTQYSIAFALAKLVETILAEVIDKREPKIERIILTGGISQSIFFQQAFREIIQNQLRAELPILISDRQGPMAAQAATAGAMTNAMIGAEIYPNLERAVNDLCLLTKCATRTC
jgi:sugar (pentulose or hexulose) kinase